jgi:hypothetical protein
MKENKNKEDKKDLLCLSKKDYEKFKNCKTPRQFLLMYFMQDTPATYFVESNTTLQCDAYRNRSLYDLYKLIRYYFPKVTKEQLCYLLFKLIITKKIVYLFCNELHNWVFYYDESDESSEIRFFKASYKKGKILDINKVNKHFINDDIVFLFKKGVQDYSMITIADAAIKYHIKQIKNKKHD